MQIARGWVSGMLRETAAWVSTEHTPVDLTAARNLHYNLSDVGEQAGSISVEYRGLYESHCRYAVSTVW